MDFRLLGRLEVSAGGVDLTPARPKQRVLLALLLLRDGATASTDELLEALWGERPPQTALTALHGHVSSLRKRLGAGLIVTAASGYAIRLADNDELDVRRFERLVTLAASQDVALRARTLEEALRLFRGPPLADVRDEAFAAADASRLDELRLSAIEQKADAELAMGRHEDLIPALERLVAEEPLRERARSLLMLALYRAGRQSDALQLAQQARIVLAAELGIEPGPSLQRLERMILDHDPDLAAPAAEPPAPRRPQPAQPGGLATFLAAATAGGSDVAGLVQAMAERHGGQLLAAEGSSWSFAFNRAGDAGEAAAAVQRMAPGLGASLRIGIHSAEVVAGDDRNLAPGARTAAHLGTAAHPGQVLVSRTSRDLLHESPLAWVELRDLGEHRLQDLGPAQRIFQLVLPGAEDQAFPPPRALDGAPTNLPIQAAPLVGRGPEIRAVVGLLSAPTARLVTLIGPGGTGKTRLALHAAAELVHDLADGAYLVQLASVRDPSLVLPAIARTLGIQESAGQAIEADLARRLDGRSLLVLDNFEHLVAAAPGIALLAAAAPRLRLLVTSRRPLELPGEQLYAVPPLQLPADDADADALGRAEAVALFVTRAKAARPDFALRPDAADAVAAICRLLDGLPLAIELAAARVSVLTPPMVLDRLTQRVAVLSAGRGAGPDRHRTMAAAIGWSHDLLEPDQQTLFMRLAAFAGGCTLESAEAVCGRDLDLVGALAALVDHSLLRLEGSDQAPRFVMLETVREYAAARLEEAGAADAVSRRHAEHFLELAERAEPHLRGTPGEWLDRLETEHDNLRAALASLDRLGDIPGKLRLAGALWRFWYLRGHLTEGRRVLEEALSAEQVDSAARGKALIGAAVMAVNGGDVEAAVRRSQEGLELHERLGERLGLAYSRFMLGSAVSASGDLARARAILAEAAAELRELGDVHSALLATRNLASIHDELGDRQGARTLHEDNLRRARATDNQRVQASALAALAMIAYDEGRIQDSLWMVLESLRLHRGLGDHLDSAVDLCRAARALALSGRAGAAARVLAAFAALRPEIGVRRTSVADLNEETLATTRRQLDEAAFSEAWRHGQELTLEQAVDLAIAALESP